MLRYGLQTDRRDSSKAFSIYVRLRRRVGAAPSSLIRASMALQISSCWVSSARLRDTAWRVSAVLDGRLSCGLQSRALDKVCALVVVSRVQYVGLVGAANIKEFSSMRESLKKKTSLCLC